MIKYNIIMFGDNNATHLVSLFLSFSVVQDGSVIFQTFDSLILIASDVTERVQLAERNQNN